MSRDPANQGTQQAATTGRRDFLAQCTGVAAAAALGPAVLGSHVVQAAAADAQTLPQIQFGKQSISRLICGSNPFNAGSHLSTFVNSQMREWYTPEQVEKTLRRCLEVGINCWQMSGTRLIEVYRKMVDSGAPLRLISLASQADELPELVKAGCLGVAHHGEKTDNFFKEGKLDTIRDFLKAVRDTGMLVGVSTHMPAVVDWIESKGWDIDYYMTCVYERNRSAEELEKLLGHVPIPVREVYLSSDPPRMYEAVRRTKRICLAFKILAAGRLSDRKNQVEQAFRDAFAGIKPSDGVIVGMYDRYSDQPGENAAYVRKYAK